MQDKVYSVKIRDVNHLHQRIKDAWNEMDQRVIDESVKQWRARLRACVREQGAQFEQKLWLFYCSKLTSYHCVKFLRYKLIFDRDLRKNLGTCLF